MGKRYKRGNVGRKRKVKPKRVYYSREKEINHQINKFKKLYYDGGWLNSYESYMELYALKSEIKQLFYEQENRVSYQSFHRRNVYYKQLARFKRVYTRWKKSTRYAFLSYICRVPPWLAMEYY